MKITSRIALAAAAGLLLGAAMTPATAADLGGGCCADLEERVAELEATTARKGNRVVSLQVYGQVNKGLLIWDDGVKSDAYVVDNAMESSRFGFTGTAKIKPGWTAGYQMEFEIGDARNDEVYAGKDGDDPEGGSSTLRLRQNYLYVESERLGRISIGHQATAGDAAAEVVLSDSLRTSDPIIGAGFTINGTGGLKLGDLATNLGPSRNDVIRYDSPSIYGFILSASWGDNDTTDVALRFKKEFKTIKIAAAVSYIWDEQSAGANSGYEQVSGSVSFAHVPTGLYASLAAGSRDYEAAMVSDPSFWYLQAGIERKLLPYGNTTVYGEYGKYSDFVGNSEATRWGFGVNQKIDSAAMDLYAHATFWSFDGVAAGPSCPPTIACLPTTSKVEDLTTLMVGSRIQF